jgi:predicted small integral membrane protein
MWLVAFMIIFVGTIIVIGGIAAWRERRFEKRHFDKQEKTAV